MFFIVFLHNHPKSTVALGESYGVTSPVVDIHEDDPENWMANVVERDRVSKSLRQNRSNPEPHCP